MLLTRRDWLRTTTVGAVGFSMSGWMQRLAADAVGKKPKRACILLWMNGGPSQMDTFDLKPGHANGGPYKERATNVPGVKISEHLPKVAGHADRLAVVRSMATKEADHGRATYLMRTGRPPAGVGARRAAARVKMLDEMEQDFIAERPGAAAVGHRTAYQRAVTMMRSEAVKAFDLEGEPKELRDRYGRNLFGQGCLLARRLV